MRVSALLILLLSSLGALEQKRERRPAQDPAVGGPARLSEIRKAPARFLGSEVRITLQFQRTIEDWNPFLSRFGPGDWLGLAAWPDESFTWDTTVFDDPLTRLLDRKSVV